MVGGESSLGMLRPEQKLCCGQSKDFRFLKRTENRKVLARILPRNADLSFCSRDAGAVEARDKKSLLAAESSQKEPLERAHEEAA